MTDDEETADETDHQVFHRAKEFARDFEINLLLMVASLAELRTQLLDDIEPNRDKRSPQHASAIEDFRQLAVYARRVADRGRE